MDLYPINGCPFKIWWMYICFLFIYHLNSRYPKYYLIEKFIWANKEIKVENTHYKATRVFIIPHSTASLNSILRV